MNWMDIRIGQGYDVHALVEGRKLILGGVDIPHTRGLLGHSDADALLQLANRRADAVKAYLANKLPPERVHQLVAAFERLIGATLAHPVIAVPLAAGRVTLNGGRIGISGNVLQTPILLANQRDRAGRALPHSIRLQINKELPAGFRLPNRGF